MFSVLDEHTKTIKLERPMNVYLAIFFHDLVYDPVSVFTMLSFHSS